MSLPFFFHFNVWILRSLKFHWNVLLRDSASDGLVSNRWQAITWTWLTKIHAAIMVSPGHNELNENIKIRLTNPQLMEMPSFCLSPVAPVLFRRSDPARSTKWNLAVNVSNSLVGPFSELSIVSTMLSTLSSPSTWEEKNCGIYQRLYST